MAHRVYVQQRVQRVVPAISWGKARMSLLIGGFIVLGSDLLSSVHKAGDQRLLLFTSATLVSSFSSTNSLTQNNKVDENAFT